MDKDERTEAEALSARDLPDALSAKAEMEACWRAMRVGGGLPRRRDLDPCRMEGALPHAFVLERMAPGVARLRVAGQAIAAHVGGEARGLPLTTLFAPASRPALGLWLDRCFGRPGLVELPLESQAGAFRAGVPGRLLLLPLLDAEGGVTRALGGIFLDRPSRRARAPFDLVHDAPARWEHIRLPGAAPALVIGGRQAPRPAGAGRPRLRLVVDNSR